MTKSYEQIWGIDVSKEWLDISIDGKVSRIEQTKEKIDGFIRQEHKSDKTTLAVLESTGGYERLAASCLNKAGFIVHIAHPNKVHDYAKARGRLAKTDQLDARLLESYGSFIKSEEIRDLPNDFQRSLNAISGRLVQLKEAHHQECCRLGLVFDAYVKSSHEELIKHLADKIKETENQLSSVIAENKALNEKRKLLESMKGIGKTISGALIAELPELGTIDKKKIAALVGLAPITKESGKKRGKAMTQYGRASVRKLLYMGALVGVRHNPRYKAFYEQLLSRGKVKKVALIAVARKMIVTLNAMVQSNTAFQA